MAGSMPMSNWTLDGAGLDAQLAARFVYVRHRTEELCRSDFNARITLSSRCRTPARSSGTWRIPLGFLRPFCWHPISRVIGHSTPNLPCYSTPITTRLAHGGRVQRGLLSRPTVEEIYHYRKHVDQRSATTLHAAGPGALQLLSEVLILGLQHEQQRQELLVTDLQHAWACNPLHPVYAATPAAEVAPLPAPAWVPFAGGICEVGYAGNGFAYDNEMPRHRVYLQAFGLANRLVTNEDYLRFIEDGGYARPELWLSDGWTLCGDRAWQAPLYWEQDAGQWFTTTLAGRRRLEPAAPVCHVSYYEADAYARWAGHRLPLESEWEVAAACQMPGGHFQEGGRWRPSAAQRQTMLGRCTNSWATCGDGLPAPMSAIRVTSPRPGAG